MFKVEKISVTDIVTCYDNGYIDHRTVKDGKVDIAKPFYKKTAQRIFSAMNSAGLDMKFKGIIPENIKYVNNDSKLVIVWTVKAHKRLLLHVNNKYQDEYALPNLIFKIEDSSLSVVAYKRFKLDALTCKAPFTNLTMSGICMGSASLKLDKYRYYEDIVEYAENQFFGSKFSHKPNPYVLFYKGVPKANNKLLIETEFTIKDFINGKTKIS